MKKAIILAVVLESTRFIVLLFFCKELTQKKTGSVILKMVYSIVASVLRVFCGIFYFMCVLIFSTSWNSLDVNALTKSKMQRVI